LKPRDDPATQTTGDKPPSILEGYMTYKIHILVIVLKPFLLFFFVKKKKELLFSWFKLVKLPIPHFATFSPPRAFMFLPLGVVIPLIVYNHGVEVPL